MNLLMLILFPILCFGFIAAMFIAVAPSVLVIVVISSLFVGFMGSLLMIMVKN